MGNKVQDIEYYPFGSIRTNTGTFNEKHKFTGHEFDADTSLNYMEARYQNGNEGRFWGEDNLFLAIGDGNTLKLLGTSLGKLLLDPQSLNSYSYARNNPLILVDPDGNMSLHFAEFANSRPEYFSQQIQNMGSNALPYFYRQTGDPQNSLRVNSQKIQDMSATAMGIAMMKAGGEGKVNSIREMNITKFDPIQQQRMALEGIENSRLKNTITDLYKKSDTIPGGTAGAVRAESWTGEATRNKFHSIKAENSINRLSNISREVNLTTREQSVVKSLKNDLKAALKRK